MSLKLEAAEIHFGLLLFDMFSGYMISKSSKTVMKGLEFNNLFSNVRPFTRTLEQNKDKTLSTVATLKCSF
jgi:hypothetical protein